MKIKNRKKKIKKWTTLGYDIFNLIATYPRVVK